MVDVLGKLRADKRVKSASYGPRYKRIRVTAHGVQPYLYRNVRQVQVFMDDDDTDGLEAFLEQTVDALIASLSGDLVEIDAAPWDLDVQEGPGNEEVADHGCDGPGAEHVPLAPNSVVEVGHPPSPLAEALLPKRSGLHPIYDGERNGSNLVALRIPWT